MAELTEELKVLITAEVDKAVKNLKQVDTKTSETEKLFKKLGSTIASTFTVKAIVGFASESVQAYQKAQSTLNVLNQTIQSTGASAWTSSKELQQMATDLQAITNYGDDEIQTMQSVLLGFKNIKGDNFREATTAILDMATVMGMDLKSAAQSIGKALDDPIKGMDSLKKQGFNFTDAQKEVIQAMLDTGDVAGAQKIVLDELAGTFGGAAEAAVNTATQIKNSWGDLKEGVGEFLTGFVNNDFGKKIVTGLNVIGEAFSTFHDNVSYLKMVFTDSEQAYREWFLQFDDADSETRINAISQHIVVLRKQIEKLNEASITNEGFIADQIREEVIKYLDLSAQEKRQASEDASFLQDKAETLLNIYEYELECEVEFAKASQKIAEQKAAQAEAENRINDLMYEIAQNYNKLSSDDPNIQLQNYLKQLEEIKQQREELSQKHFDSLGNLIDTTVALEELDYIEEKIKEKIKKIQDDIKDDSKKTWQKWFSEITEVDESKFTTGHEAARAFLKQMGEEFKLNQDLSEMLGEKFDYAEALEKQQEKIKSVLKEIFSIDPSEIDDSFTAEDNVVKDLIAQYKQLGLAREAALVKTEEEKTFTNLAEKLGYATETWLDELDLWDEKTNEVVGNITSSLAQISFTSTINGMKELGKAFGEGKDATDSMQQALVSMAQEILDQLPLLLTQAGLQLIAQGQWQLGLGLIVGGLADSLVAGYVDGRTSSKANALGGIYGDSSYEAFANGGAFTNQIVSKPTFFRFAKGSGFGTGLMGEAGPEAIMPLTRGADGSLGVRADGSGSNVNVNVPVYVYSSEPVEVHDTEDDNGQRQIEILVGSVINQHIAGGRADKALKSRYGLKVLGV